MDMSYLLFLQDFRNSIADAWTPFLEGTSLFAVTYLLLLPVFIYWCVDKRKGLFTLAALNLCLAINALIKLTACVYRPWIKDARILPAGNAINTATGYSFPSGHTSTAVPVYGGMAVEFWDKKSTKWLSVLCVAAILVTGFSRNYLGVHTPQDVLMAMVEGVFSLWIVWKILAYVDKHPEKEDYFLLGGFILCVLGILYITFKPYPMDYIDGKLLVDPHRMMNDGYKDIGTLGAFCVGRYIEKRWIGFKVTGWTVKGILTGVVGLVLLGVMIANLQKPVVSVLGPHWGRLVTQSVIVTYCVALWPWVLKWVGPKDKAAVKAN